MLKKLGSDDYKRPKHTATEKLSNEQIQKLLEDYTKVENINNVPVGTHLRYFSIDENNNKKFRRGGLLHNNKGLPDYVILSNGKQTWSVQVKNTIFYKKMTLVELKNKYKTRINTYAEKLNEFQKLIDDLTKENKILTDLLTKNRIPIKNYNNSNNNSNNKSTRSNN